ncbi:hypothetical protein TWF694_001492 [Orbilia ellipsospora]|uniref:Clr5 domain-containing protein n=1 Tax=Orbilia ellipsospora TaxID=2528407 RepID=A0AAV9XRQ7_9PEZI
MPNAPNDSTSQRQALKFVEQLNPNIKRRYVKIEQWLPHRELIRKLRSENRSAKDICDCLRERGFHVSVSQLKTILKAWNFGVNLTRQRRQAIRDKIAVREAEGKPQPVFIYRGTEKAISNVEVLGKLKQYHEEDQKQNPSHRESGTTGTNSRKPSSSPGFIDILSPVEFEELPWQENKRNQYTPSPLDINGSLSDEDWDEIGRTVCRILQSFPDPESSKSSPEGQIGHLWPESLKNLIAKLSSSIDLADDQQLLSRRLSEDENSVRTAEGIPWDSGYVEDHEVSYWIALHNTAVEYPEFSNDDSLGEHNHKSSLLASTPTPSSGNLSESDKILMDQVQDMLATCGNNNGKDCSTNLKGFHAIFDIMSELPSEHFVYLLLFRTLAQYTQCTQDLGYLEDTVEVIQQFLPYCEIVLGEMHDYSISMLQRLFNCSNGLKFLKKSSAKIAEQSLDSLFHRYERKYGEKAPITQETVLKRAQNFADNGDTKKAEELCNAVEELVLAEESNWTDLQRYTLYRAYGGVLKRRGLHHKAFLQYSKAISIGRLFQNAYNPNAGWDFIWSANTLCSIGNYETSLRWYRRGLITLEESLGPAQTRSIDFLENVNNLSMAMYKRGLKLYAAPTAYTIFKGYEKFFGLEDTRVRDAFLQYLKAEIANHGLEFQKEAVEVNEESEERFTIASI